MKIIGLSLLQAFIKQYPETKKWIENWIADVRSAKWLSSHDIKQRYSSASFLAQNVVIFNVKGKNYRLQVNVAYKNGVVVIDWIGTHADYTKRSKAAAK